MQGAIKVADAAAIAVSAIAEDSAALNRQHASVVDAATERSIIAGESGVGHCQSDRIFDAAAIGGGGVAGKGAALHYQCALAQDAAAVVGAVARKSAALHCQCVIVARDAAAVGGAVAGKDSIGHCQHTSVVDTSAVVIAVGLVEGEETILHVQPAAIVNAAAIVSYAAEDGKVAERDDAACANGKHAHVGDAIIVGIAADGDGAPAAVNREPLVDGERAAQVDGIVAVKGDAVAVARSRNRLA